MKTILARVVRLIVGVWSFGFVCDLVLAISDLRLRRAKIFPIQPGNSTGSLPATRQVPGVPNTNESEDSDG